MQAILEGPKNPMLALGNGDGMDYEEEGAPPPQKPPTANGRLAPEDPPGPSKPPAGPSEGSGVRDAAPAGRLIGPLPLTIAPDQSERGKGVWEGLYRDMKGQKRRGTLYSQALPGFVESLRKSNHTWIRLHNS